MSLKDLAEKARQQTSTQGELQSGSGRSTYNFADSSEYDYPNASEYSEGNKNVGKEVPNTRTVGVIGEDQIASGAKEMSTALQSVDDVLGITDPVLKKFIFDSDFVFNQTKLRALNKMAGQVFNPVGIISTIASEDSNSIALQAIKQSISDIVGGGAYKTTDGKTFYSAMDTDSQSEVFSAKGFKSETEGSTGIVDVFLNNLQSSIGQAIGIETPTRSILAQVVSYDKSLFEEFDDDTYTWFKEGNGEIEYDSTTAIEISPIGADAINYIHDPQLLAEDPVKYYEIRRKIKNGLLAQNVLAPKSDDIVKAEAKANAESKGILNQIKNFVEDRVFDGVQEPRDFYKHDKEPFRPEDGNLFNDIIDHMYGDFVNNTSPNSVSAEFLKGLLKDFYRGKQVTNFNSTKTREEERLDKVEDYGFSTKNPTDSQKVTSDTFEDVTENEEGYRYHNIEPKLGTSLRDKIRDKTFSELRSISQDQGQDDEIMGSDISDVPAEYLGEDFGTQQFMAIEDIRTDKVIYLRPAFDNISEDIQINNGDFFYIGRTEPFPNYENTTRAVTLSFKMYADTPNEYLMMWKKMDFLNSLAYPIATEADNFKNIQNPLLKFTIGNLFRRVGGYLNTLNYSYSNQDVTWETERGKIAPKIIDVSMSFTVLHDEMPFVHKNNEFQFDKSEESQQFNSYDVDYSELNEGEG